MSFLGNVFKKMTLFDNRKSQRLDAPMLVAYYWDGATPNAHPIRNISSQGFYLLTDERMRPGTVITMTLQRSSPQKVDSASTPHLSVMSMVVRQGEDGIGFTFLPQEPKDSDPVQDPRKPAGRKAITKFLQQLDTDPGVADGFIAPPIPLRNTPARKPQRFAILLANESGQSLIIAALCTTCLFGFVALAADVGIMLREKRLLQIAADSAAIGGASDFSYGNATTAAQAAAAQNGFTNGSGGATVTVNSPPLYGAYAGHAGYVEVIASQNQPTIFMGFFGRSAMAVTARAVATTAPSSACIYTLGSSQGISASGGAALTDTSCGVIVDSSSNSGINVSGGATITVNSIGVVASGDNVSGGARVTPAPVFNIIPVSDPLLYLQPSAPSYNVASLSCAAAINVSGSRTQTVAASGTPACYNGISVSGGSTLNITNPGVIVINGNIDMSGGSTVNFGAGLYYITGIFSASGGNTASGTGVTFYAASGGSFNLSGGVNLTLAAPTSGTDNGILFWQAQGNAQTLTMSGGSTSSLQGVIYAPSAPLAMSGGSSSNLYVDLVVSSLSLSGGANLQSYAAVNANSPLRLVKLVE
jgi:Putative Flp pilus-assembly TadE/G-like